MDHTAEWNEFKAKFNREYKDDAEEQLRYKIFCEKLNMINTHNERHKAGQESYSMGINHFCDRTPDEIKPMTGGVLKPSSKE